jgi:hypothetical protein
LPLLPFSVPTHWREWLGTVRTSDVENCNLFLFSKLSSSTPDIWDTENQQLPKLVSHFYTGLLLVSPFAPAHKPVMLSGARRCGEIDIRQQQDFESPVPSVFRPYPPVVFDDLRVAAELGGNIGALGTSPPTGGAWRLF